MTTSMWIFGGGETGVYVYSPDGKQQKNHVTGEALCGSKDEFNGPSYAYCTFMDIVSDNKKYVWAGAYAANPPDESRIAVFDIDTQMIRVVELNLT